MLSWATLSFLLLQFIGAPWLPSSAVLRIEWEESLARSFFWERGSGEYLVFLMHLDWRTCVFAFLGARMMALLFLP